MAEVPERIRQLVEQVDGVVGVAARHLRTGAEFAMNADTVFPTASTMKIFLLYELLRQVEQGITSLDERLAVTERDWVPGSGVLQDMDPGLHPTLKDLATLMIVVSDNTATDILFDRLGRAQVNETLVKLGLERTRLPMNIRDMRYSLIGFDVNNPEHTYEKARAKFLTSERVENPRALADQDSDLSTPTEMVRFLAAIEQGEYLNASYTAIFIDIMTRQKYNTIIPLLLPDNTRIAHKTGSLGGVRNDVGIVHAPNGPYVVAIMSKQLANEVEGARALAEISLEVWKAFTE